jgi:simple sugar transport system permease protein
MDIEPQAADAGTPEPESNWQRFLRDLTGVDVDWRGAVLVPVLAIVSALIVGGIIIVVTDIELWRQFSGEALGNSLREVRDASAALFTGSLWGLKPISETLTNSAPLILAGLAVGIGFRAGLFNIGAEGQIIIGAMFAVAIGISLDLPAVINIPIAIAFALIGGGIYGAIPGLLRAKTGAHEVITTIMLNNIAFFLLTWLLRQPFFQAEGRQDPVSKEIFESAKLPRLLGFLDRVDLRVHAGIIVAILAAWFVHWLLFKSTLGFEFRAVGFNPDAAKYAGMSVTWIYVAVMAVAGALAGLAGLSQINGVLYRASPGFSADIGFDAISLALLGRSHPWGIVVAGLLFGALKAGGQEMQAATDVPIDLILVIQALVVVFIAAPALIRAIYRVKAGEGTGQLTKGWAS